MPCSCVGSPRSASIASDAPSGDHAGSPLEPFESVNTVTSLPSGRMVKTSLTTSESFGLGSLRLLSKASLVRSGDHTGQPLSAGPLVSFVGWVRRLLATQTCQRSARSLNMYAMRPFRPGFVPSEAEAADVMVTNAASAADTAITESGMRCLMVGVAREA